MVLKLNTPLHLQNPSHYLTPNKEYFVRKGRLYNIKYMYKSDFLYIFSKNVWWDKKLYLYLRAEKPKRVERN